MSRIFVIGSGAVSPAGWGVRPMIEALEQREEIPPQIMPGPNGRGALRVRMVPSPKLQLPCLAHPRMRRASAISRFAAGASCEALEAFNTSNNGKTRLGIVVGVHTACIRYSERFYGEVCRSPSTASPMLFSETVMNAPASHLAALFKETSITYTVIGDQTAFIQALCVAAGWLTDNRVDAALVVSSEEAAWPMAAAVRHFSKSMVAAEGAGALLLSRESQQARSVALELVTDAHIYAGRTGKKAAAQAMRCEFPDGSLDEVLVDGRCGAERVDAPESAAWRDWTGARLSPRMILGEGLSAATAWQFAAAVHALKMAQFKAANISVVGGNEEAIGARLATW